MCRLPHTGQNLWFVLDSVDELKKLLDNLHPQGVRESTLKVALLKNYDSIVKSLCRTSRFVIHSIFSYLTHFAGILLKCMAGAQYY